MVSEPKAHVTKGKAIKRQNEKGEVVQQVMANQPLLTYYMNSLAGGVVVQNPLPAAKRPREEDANGDTSDFFARTDTDMVMDEEIDLDALKTYGTPDILICGNCRLKIRDVNFLSSLFFHFKNDF